LVDVPGGEAAHLLARLKSTVPPLDDQR
jgi:hypothetical protein